MCEVEGTGSDITTINQIGLAAIYSAGIGTMRSNKDIIVAITIDISSLGD